MVGQWEKAEKEERVDKKAKEEKLRENTRDKIKETTKRTQRDTRCDVTNTANPGLTTLTVASRSRRNRKMTNHRAPTWEVRFTS